MAEILERVWGNKYSFLGTFFVVFTLTYIVLLAVDFLPEEKSIEVIESTGEVVEEYEVVEEALVSPEQTILPTEIFISKLNKSIPVLNPESRNIADLDTALLSGVVRHPDSATLNQEGNVFILGHSSYLPKVLNENFQAFNGIQDLAFGDTIDVYSEDKIYKYRVEKVYRAKAEEVTVPIAGTGNMLTLATCNSFGSVDDRYIVEAKRVDTQNI